MFSPRKRPLLLVADRLRALRLSLNTPVLSTPELPAGPARAAIAMHVEGQQTCFTVVVRSLRDGASVLYELEGEDLDDVGAEAVALDAALSFGESMGFLFDDEVIVDRSPETLRLAVARLRELVAAPEPGADDSEILLDEEAVEAEAAIARARGLQDDPTADVDALAAPAAPPGDDDTRIVEEPDAPPTAHEAAPEPAAPRRLALTKFRGASEVPAPPAPPAAPDSPSRSRATGRAAAGGARLGRVRPIRVRAGAASAPEGPPPPSPLLRLLSAF